MTAQILSSELANLIQESKRKNTELRNVSYTDILLYDCFVARTGLRDFDFLGSREVIR
jgi:hypothetical protein